MYKLDEEYLLAEKLEGISLSNDVIKHSKKEARYLASKVKLEHAPETSCISGISPVEELEDARIWVNNAHVNTFILIFP